MDRDRRIAMALGWTDIAEGSFGLPEGIPPDDDMAALVPEYDQPEHAFSLLEELLRRGYTVEFHTYPNGSFSCHARSENTYAHEAGALADAICEVFLKVVEK